MRTWKNGILLPFLLVLLWYIISKLQIFSHYSRRTDPQRYAVAAFTDKPAESSRWLPLFSRCRFTFGYPVRTQQLFSVLLLAYPGIPASCAAFGCNTADNPLVRH